MSGYHYSSRSTWQESSPRRLDREFREENSSEGRENILYEQTLEESSPLVHGEIAHGNVDTASVESTHRLYGVEHQRDYYLEQSYGRYNPTASRYQMNGETRWDGYRGRHSNYTPPRSRSPWRANDRNRWAEDRRDYPNLSSRSQSPWRTNDSYAVDRSNLPSQRSPFRSPSPPPPPPRRSPSPGYLDLSKTPSVPVHDPPTESRKLLILDLNGTLLVRSKRGTGPLRAVYPRAYIPSFRQYLFHPDTRAWLDVMIWSSAMPPNVRSMAERCFGSNCNDLIAIWARDTLGLSREDYSQKSVTIKDLAKPWSELPVSENGVPHSALSTLLLDDSPVKARVQPYNHLCIKEYSLQRRDLDVTAMIKQNKDAAEAAPTIDHHYELSEDAIVRVDQPEAPEGDVETDAPIGNLHAVEQEQTAKVVDGDQRVAGGPDQESHKRSRQRLHKRKRLPSESPDAVHDFDETLLAIIGILDAARNQSNVAAWIRSGALWAGHFPTTTTDLPGSDDTPSSPHPNPLVGNHVQSEVPGESRDADADADGHTKPPPSSQRTDIDAGPNDDDKNESDLSADEDKPGQPPRKRHKRASHLSRATREGSDAGFVPAGNDATTAATSPPGTSPHMPSSSVAEDHGDAISKQPEAESLDHNLWFEHEDTHRVWVQRGRLALDALGIPEEHGISVQ
ncbi:hypothetical protein BD410DRAFT_787363 [Rickenella mellea]|uniref:FCP1 homology domain-containing protein n=1 Tax=Rickenella mellea TaxID=50990 RepID=A0A4Y7Q799_9AGAM|nr:hypothetical protein BD410DRAFT_787363 [Rickenella mellea]